MFLYDAEPKALEWAQGRFSALSGQLGRPLAVKSRVVSARELVSGEADLTDAAPVDMVLVLGLFDYLKDGVVSELIDRLVAVLRPGGRLLCTNVAAPNPWRTAMEYICAWQVLHRTVPELVDMVVHGRPDLSVIDARLDASGTNVFLAIERSYGV
jgi:extracellular factor (EF) 3-hydroxypalmitic acid methyl ester biosynthesis protein